MQRLIRLVLVAGLVSSVALLPIAARANTQTLTVSLFGIEYSVGVASCGETGSFAGLGKTSSGQGVAFNTTICHGPLGDTNGASASINPGGSFVVYTSSTTLVGKYVSGNIGPGHISPLYASSVFCREDFPVSNVLLTNGTAYGVLTHIGFFSGGGSMCTPFAASISAHATLNY